MGTETGFWSSSLFRNLPHRRLMKRLAAVSGCDRERFAALLVHGFDLLAMSYKPGTRPSSEHEMYAALSSIAWTNLEEVTKLRRLAESMGLVRRDENGYYLSLCPEDGMSDEGKRIAEVLFAIRREERACRGCAAEEEMGENE